MLYGAYCSVYWLLAGVWVCVCVCAFYFVALYASVSTQTCPSPWRARVRSAWEELLSYLLICEKLISSHAVRGSHFFFLRHLLLKHTFPRLSCSSYITFRSSDSSWAIKLMSNKVNQAETTRSRTSFPIKLEDRDGNVEILYSHRSCNIYVCT